MNIFKNIVYDTAAFYLLFTFIVLLGHLPLVYFSHDLIMFLSFIGILFVILLIFSFRLYKTSKIIKYGLNVKGNFKLIRVGYGGNCSGILNFSIDDFTYKKTMNIQEASFNKDMTVNLKVDPSKYKSFIIITADDPTIIAENQ